MPHSSPNSSRCPTVGVKVKFLHSVWREHALAYATECSAGLDLRACIDEPELIIPAGG
ncbi:dUTP diphosphatase, partial [Desulfocurvibacter africanus]